MITGFNTDVEHSGVVYHVQTEDKGLKSPLLLSLVYVGGTIIASKRTPYEDLIAEGFDEAKLAERLQRQHKLICAAIRAGRIEDLKRQTEREAAARSKSHGAVEADEHPPAATSEEELVIELGSIADFMPPSSFESPPATSDVTPAPELVVEEVSVQPPSEWEHVDYSQVVDYSDVASSTSDLQITLLEDRKFIAGQFVKINIHVGRGPKGMESVPHVAVSLKILGSSFRPQLFTGKTGRDGTTIFYAMLPYFTSGRAAILISATLKSERAELRRMIHQVRS